MKKIRFARHRRRAIVLSAQWQRRAIFLFGGIAVGTLAVGLALAADYAQYAFSLLIDKWRYAAFAVTPLGFALSVFLTHRYFPNSQGSGIPQAIAARQLTDQTARARLVSLRVAIGKRSLADGKVEAKWRRDSEAMMADYEFVEMLEYGMPPTCGFGFGERFFSILADMPLRDTQLFPLMKPER